MADLDADTLPADEMNAETQIQDDDDDGDILDAPTQDGDILAMETQVDDEMDEDKQEQGGDPLDAATLVEEEEDYAEPKIQSKSKSESLFDLLGGSGSTSGKGGSTKLAKGGSTKTKSSLGGGFKNMFASLSTGPSGGAGASLDDLFNDTVEDDSLLDSGILPDLGVKDSLTKKTSESKSSLGKNRLKVMKIDKDHGLKIENDISPRRGFRTLSQTSSKSNDGAKHSGKRVVADSDSEEEEEEEDSESPVRKKSNSKLRSNDSKKSDSNSKTEDKAAESDVEEQNSEEEVEKVGSAKRSRRSKSRSIKEESESEDEAEDEPSLSKRTSSSIRRKGTIERKATKDVSSTVTKLVKGSFTKSLKSSTGTLLLPPLSESQENKTDIPAIEEPAAEDDGNETEPLETDGTESIHSDVETKPKKASQEKGGKKRRVLPSFSTVATVKRGITKFVEKKTAAAKEEDDVKDDPSDTDQKSKKAKLTKKRTTTTTRGRGRGAKISKKSSTDSITTKTRKNPSRSSSKLSKDEDTNSDHCPSSSSEPETVKKSTKKKSGRTVRPVRKSSQKSQSGSDIEKRPSRKRVTKQSTRSSSKSPSLSQSEEDTGRRKGVTRRNTRSSGGSSRGSGKRLKTGKGQTVVEADVEDESSDGGVDDNGSDEEFDPEVEHGKSKLKKKVASKSKKPVVRKTRTRKVKA